MPIRQCLPELYAALRLPCQRKFVFKFRRRLLASSGVYLTHCEEILWAQRAHLFAAERHNRLCTARSRYELDFELTRSIDLNDGANVAASQTGRRKIDLQDNSIESFDRHGYCVD